MARTAFDEWEISRGDLHVLEKIGEGFFGIVHKAYLYHHALKQQKMRSELKRDFGNDDYKSAVACKMLKGLNILFFQLSSLFSLFSILYRHFPSV